MHAITGEYIRLPMKLVVVIDVRILSVFLSLSSLFILLRARRGGQVIHEACGLQRGVVMLVGGSSRGYGHVMFVLVAAFLLSNSGRQPGMVWCVHTEGLWSVGFMEGRFRCGGGVHGWVLFHGVFGYWCE